MRVFRIDDTSIWPYKFGSGVDGNSAASSSGTIDSSYGANYIPFTGTAGQLTGSLSSPTASITPVLIHQTQGTGAGNYELNFINNPISSTAATLLLPLQNNYIGGAQLITARQFLSFTINPGVTLSVPAWNGSTGGIGFIMCNVSLTCSGTLNAGGAGFRGGPGEYSNAGTGFTGEGYLGGGSNAVGAPNGRTSPTNLGAGQGGGQCQIGSNAGGGGGHAFAGGNSSGYNGGGNGGTGGTAYDNAGLTLMTLGSGGGGGGQWENNSYNGAGNGGIGGGIWFIIARLITVTGTITCVSQAGGTVPTQGGGGGAGGAILLKGQQISFGTNITSVGGTGGNTTGGGTNGGTGSVGFIHADYLVTPTGTTNPGADTRFDPVLQDNSPIIALF